MPVDAVRTAVTDADPAPSGAVASHDPFAPIEASSRGRTVLALLAFVAAAAAVTTGLAPIAGPLGMVLGLVAHVKGSRLGLPAAVLSGAGMILGFAVTMLLR